MQLVFWFYGSMPLKCVELVLLSTTLSERPKFVLPSVRVRDGVTICNCVLLSLGCDIHFAVALKNNFRSFLTRCIMNVIIRTSEIPY